jgi:hypothetical protein
MEYFALYRGRTGGEFVKLLPAQSLAVAQQAAVVITHQSGELHVVRRVNRHERRAMKRAVSTAESEN